ncbi:uncharacterized protein LOC105701541 [Orussus abietinus]|uniref:uncharacterized protein LOC105701541 n=1 Tax=Orussus abietinus TaxID=222816 RepID=UPI00062650D6|nr:uncharacterized protein LOC105701541 [Orussus abietinus]
MVSPMRSTRGWWLLLGGFALISLGNPPIASGQSESAVEGELHQDEARQHHCCARREKMIDVGYGISGDVIQIDAGHCRRICPLYVEDDPGDPSRPAVQICPPDWHCRPSSARLERVSTLQGVTVVEAVDTCDCIPRQPCSRESYTHVVHPGTPHQVDMDVGLCMGHCNKDLGCKPLRNRTISIVGPNGDEVHQVIAECGCGGDCYRMNHVETVLDFSEVEITEGTNTTDVKPVVRTIDVGQCIGGCPGKETETCLLRDKKEPSRCLAGLYSKQHSCMPARFKIHEYRSRRGSKREIIAITQCACV